VRRFNQQFKVSSVTNGTLTVKTRTVEHSVILHNGSETTLIVLAIKQMMDSNSNTVTVSLPLLQLTMHQLLLPTKSQLPKLRDHHLVEESKQRLDKRYRCGKQHPTAVLVSELVTERFTLMATEHSVMCTTVLKLL
jgi:hypothetical protein